MHKPAVPKYILLILSGLLWAYAGSILLRYAYTWLTDQNASLPLIFASSGLILGLLIHFLGFSKVVTKNLKRIAEMPDKPCIFGFMSWKSYLLIMFMMGLGISLRYSSIPKPYLSIIYIGIGSALIFSGSRYFALLFSKNKN